MPRVQPPTAAGAIINKRDSMSKIVKIIIALIIAAVISSAVTVLQGGQLPDLILLAAFAIATVVTALLPSASTSPATAPKNKQRSAGKSKPRAEPQQSTDAEREYGQVKWFNVSKGFGFITMDDGEEIFVHFRSIRGEGRRGLRDGQRVSFVVADSDKGPQAEDVSDAE